MCTRRWVGLLLVAVPVYAFVFVPFKDAGREPVQLAVKDPAAPRASAEDRLGCVYLLSDNQLSILPPRAGERSSWTAPEGLTVTALEAARSGVLVSCRGEGGARLIRLVPRADQSVGATWTRHFAELPAGQVHVTTPNGPAEDSAAIVGVVSEDRLYLLRDSDGEVLFDRPVGHLLCPPLWAEDSLFIAKDDAGTTGVTPAGRMVLGFELSAPSEAGIPLHFDWKLPVDQQPESLEWLPGSRRLAIHTNRQDYLF